MYMVGFLKGSGALEAAIGQEAQVDALDAPSAASAALRDLGEFIREQRKGAQLSIRKLASQAGVSNPYLSQIERGLRKPSAEILQSLARALRISAETLYVKAGMLDERDDDLVTRILADGFLTEAQKRALVEIYRSFRAQAPAPPVPDDTTDTTDTTDKEHL